MKGELLVILFGALPVLEVRGAIPFGMAVFQFSLGKAYLLGVLGNMLPIVPGLFFLNRFSELLMHRWYLYNRIMTWVFERARREHAGHTHSWEWATVGLFVFVAIPFPLTGAWSGMVLAYILGIPFWHAVTAICLGILASGAIVSALISFGLLAVRSIF